MGDEWQPEAMLNRKLDQLKDSMFDYIEKNIERIDASPPVFFGHVAAALERSFPDIRSEVHDEFIDAIALKLLMTMKTSPGNEQIEKVLRHAMGMKRGKRGRATLEIIAGLKLINSGNYVDAIEYLAKYRQFDAAIYTAIAYCHYAQSLPRTGAGQQGPRPNEMELRAREEMLALARARPPINRIRSLELKDSQLNALFWFMLDLAIEWFPGEPELLRIGIRKAKADGDAGRRSGLLRIATDRFHDDRDFLAESFAWQIEQRNGSGAAGIVKQMMQQYPDDPEPIYFGLKLAIIASQQQSYASFRKLAIIKGMPQHLLLITDCVFEAFCGRKNEAILCFEEVKRAYGRKHHYISALEYILRDAFSGDDERARRAKSTLLHSVDQYCMRALQIQHD
ncbi:MAG: hypothetical protein KO206_06880 [Methanomicrobiaceae archaeon]|uniref:Uncharacterized protein n=1 Tax=hydrocarbon metagenome TaxID=938273 RepID=A0A0W8FL28_9ZZZZ|nr:hypothetical protein [Methanomicrobiaceae archaeon]MDD5419635.1 hypothetical protein [Methanomicrobiaceae archaeon]